MKEIVQTFRRDLFAGQTVLLSGATSGIGLAMARGFRDLGADVICTGTSLPKIEKARTVDANARIRFEQLDVRDSKGIRAFVGGLPRLDVLVNAAGIARRDKEFEEDVYLDVVDVNLHSVMRLSMAARLAEARGFLMPDCTRRFNRTPSGWRVACGSGGRAGGTTRTSGRGRRVGRRGGARPTAFDGGGEIFDCPVGANPGADGGMAGR